ncbi:hypothetical protein [Geomesophilobacter sediminis]|uniref:PDGLE domain-containing protein n=1 Tax=Geomesophilobacter sediminis TaxID=2798584 RepID=A0A8J7LYZ6_9BACT|nr:hypothetical protein [Geomesophilobacter sediminis]MBJ6725812.1 hypothetical protein [Geomesophilobacter sediminis]
MTGPKRKLQERLHLAGLVVLVAGVAGGLLIYFTATEVPDAVDLEESKVYLRNLELYGGKANILATDLSNWFYGLWQGKSLGVTVAVIGTFIGLLLLFVAKQVADDER